MAEKILDNNLFLWVGADRRGTTVKGQTRAASVSIVKADLRRQGIKPIRIKQKSALFERARKKKITPKDIAVLSRQLATMMAAGVPMVQAFEIMGRGHDNATLRDLILTIKGDLESGSALADALGKHPLYFDDLFCHLVRAGEQAGVLETLLHRIATYKEKTEIIKGKIKKAMFYPGAVIVVAVLVTTLLLMYVVPQFESLFKGFGADLPAFTRVVLGLSRFFQEWWWAIFGVTGLGIYGLIQAHKRSRKFRHGLDRMLLKMPVLGHVLHKAAIARYARTLSTMFAAGVPLVEAMQSVSGATGNTVYAEAVLRMRDGIATGQQLNAAMQQTELFPHMVVQMTAIGEESGALDAMLAKVADFYEQEVDNAIDALTSLMEPVIIVVIGTLIGGLIVAMYLPIFNLGKVI